MWLRNRRKRRMQCSLRIEGYCLPTNWTLGLTRMIGSLDQPTLFRLGSGAKMLQ